MIGDKKKCGLLAQIYRNTCIILLALIYYSPNFIFFQLVIVN